MSRNEWVIQIVKIGIGIAVGVLALLSLSQILSELRSLNSNLLRTIQETALRCQ